MTTSLTDDKTTLKVLKLLKDGEITKDDLQDKLNIKPTTVYKHLKMLKKTGLEIEKNDDKYKLVEYKKLIAFAKYEINTLTYLLFLGNILFEEKKFDHLLSAFKKIILLSNKNDYKKIKKLYNSIKTTCSKEYYRNKITLIEKNMIDNKKVAISTLNGKEISFKHYNFDISKNDNLILNYTDLQDNIGSIPLNEIIKIGKENNQNEDEINLYSNEVIFEIYGKLTKSYLLRDDERMIDFTKDKLVIASANPDKNALFRRLLRYDSYCKVILPKQEVNNFKAIIQKTLDNLS